MILITIVFLGLFNLRGSDIDYNPVFFSYAIVTMDDVRYVFQVSKCEISVIDWSMLWMIVC